MCYKNTTFKLYNSQRNLKLCFPKKSNEHFSYSFPFSQSSATDIYLMLPSQKYNRCNYSNFTDEWMLMSLGGLKLTDIMLSSVEP